MQGELKDQDFKSIITGILTQRKGIDSAYRLVNKKFHSQHGVKLDNTGISSDLNAMVDKIYNAAYPRHQHFRREHPAQFIIESIRGNFRAQASHFAHFAKQVKLALPKFALEEASLKQLFDTLTVNEVYIKPIKAWSGKMKGTLLMSFVSQDGLKAIAQYHLAMLKLQVQIEELLKSDSFKSNELSAT